MALKNQIAAVVAGNVQALLRSRGMTQPDLAKRSKVSMRMIAYVLSGDRTPTIKTLSKLATGFGIQAWQLMVEDQKLNALIDNYNRSVDTGRQFIMHVAEKEARYSKQPAQGGNDGDDNVSRTQKGNQ